MEQLVKNKKVGLFLCIMLCTRVWTRVRNTSFHGLVVFKNGVSVNPFWRAKIKPMKGHETANGVGPIDTVDEFYFNIHYHPDALPLGSATPDEKNLLRINNIWTRDGYLAKR